MVDFPENREMGQCCSRPYTLFLGVDDLGVNIFVLYYFVFVLTMTYCVSILSLYLYVGWKFVVQLLWIIKKINRRLFVQVFHCL